MGKTEMTVHVVLQDPAIAVLQLPAVEVIAEASRLGQKLFRHTLRAVQVSIGCKLLENRELIGDPVGDGGDQLIRSHHPSVMLAEVLVEHHDEVVVEDQAGFKRDVPHRLQSAFLWCDGFCQTRFLVRNLPAIDLSSARPPTGAIWLLAHASSSTTFSAAIRRNFSCRRFARRGEQFGFAETTGSFVDWLQFFDRVRADLEFVHAPRAGQQIALHTPDRVVIRPYTTIQ